jgi:uncharacterized protein YbaP (TraB family)
LLVAFALHAGCAATGPEAARPEPARAASPREQATPLLWRASGPAAGDGPLFLLGSVHIGRPGAVEFGSEVADAYATCDELVVEVDLSALSADEIAAQSVRHVSLPDGQMLRGLLSDETYRLLEAHLRSRGIPMAVVERMKPWAVTTLLVMLEFESVGLQGDYGVDRQFIERAAGRRPIRGLETLRSQLTLFDGLPPRIQELMLEDTLLHVEEVARQSNEIVAAWERGDEAALTQFLFASREEHPEFEDFYEAVFFARNEIMAGQLARLVADGKRRLVVLGAGHMVGPRGIPALLAARGFDVRRVGRR